MQIHALRFFLALLFLNTFTHTHTHWKASFFPQWWKIQFLHFYEHLVDAIRRKNLGERILIFLAWQRITNNQSNVRSFVGRSHFLVVICSRENPEKEAREGEKKKGRSLKCTNSSNVRRNISLLKSVNRRISCSSETRIDEFWGFQLVQCSVGYLAG